VIPLYALIEPWETLRRRQTEMHGFAQDIQKKLRALERMQKVGVPPGTHKTLGQQFRTRSTTGVRASKICVAR